MTIEEARKKVTDYICSDCAIKFNCSNPEKRMDFRDARPCRYKRKLPGKRVKQESSRV